MNPIARFLHELAASGALDLPRPGGGATPERHHALLELARVHPVSVARLVEAHTDAVAIRAEGGYASDPRLLYGVWASETAEPGPPVIDRTRQTITGVKQFCSGLGVVDRALVTAIDDGGHRVLVEVDVTAAPTIRWTTEAWTSPALVDASTGTITFDAHPVSADATVGTPRWYLERPGFWHGACGPAACWAGAAVGLVDVAEGLVDSNPHRVAELGGMRTAVWVLRALVDRAGREIDDDPTDAAGTARWRALALRHAVERTCSEVLDRFSQALGPRPFTSDRATAQRYADTHLYLRQHKGSVDLHELGASSSSGATPAPAQSAELHLRR